MCMPQVLQRSKSEMKMKCRNFSVTRMKLLFKKHLMTNVCYRLYRAPRVSCTK